MNRWIRQHTLEMLSNGTIDGFILCLKKRKMVEYNHFQRLLMMSTPIVMFDRTADGIGVIR
jgi:LacI family transcriptional regulator